MELSFDEQKYILRLLHKEEDRIDCTPNHNFSEQDEHYLCLIDDIKDKIITHDFTERIKKEYKQEVISDVE